MNYYSISDRSITANFRQATMAGQAPDGGLFFPEYIPVWEKEFMHHLNSFSKAEIGFRVMQPFAGGMIPDAELLNIIEETLDFPFPLQQISDRIFCMELFHGPTLAFKDLGARFLSRCMGYFAKDNNQKNVVLVATSGDTGGAVADAFFNVPGTEVVILYPSGKVSSVQEKQLTGLGGNIHALEVNGDFDDCQRLVKQAFKDESLKKNILLTSSNSINISRWLSQQIYYVLACAQWKDPEPPVFSVPSGNFGNLCAGLLAQKSGLPAAHFIAACNSNDVFTQYIREGVYKPQSAKKTVSNAMDVGDPSNFSRILELYRGNHGVIKEEISSYTINDQETLAAIRDVNLRHHVLLDPHSAVAFASLEDWLVLHPSKKGIIMGTAHPIKFPDVVEQAVSAPVAMPARLKELLQRPKKAYPLEPTYAAFKKTFLELTGH
jgi:threonine synthase